MSGRAAVVSNKSMVNMGGFLSGCVPPGGGWESASSDEPARHWTQVRAPVVAVVVGERLLRVHAFIDEFKRGENACAR
ncbi:hypothetical protein FXW78_42880 [Rhodococcus opacus]|nr:hypothetical protein [Rhodococcus opacus]